MPIKEVVIVVIGVKVHALKYAPDPHIRFLHTLLSTFKRAYHPLFLILCSDAIRANYDKMVLNPPWTVLDIQNASEASVVFSSIRSHIFSAIALIIKVLHEEMSKHTNNTLVCSHECIGFSSQLRENVTTTGDKPHKDGWPSASKDWQRKCTYKNILFIWHQRRFETPSVYNIRDMSSVLAVFF